MNTDSKKFQKVSSSVKYTILFLMAYFLLSNSTQLDKPPDRSALVLSTKYAIQEQKGPSFGIYLLT